MNVAIMSYSFMPLWRDGRMNLFGYLESCRYRYGLQSADLWNKFLASEDDEYLEKVIDALEERDLDVVNFAVDGAHIWDEDADAREQYYRNALTNLSIAEKLGASTVRIDAGGTREANEFTDEQFDLIVKRYREYAQRAYDNGYKVGPENHWGPTVNPTTVRKICEAVDHPGFGILLHTARWRGDAAEQGDELVADWAVHTHFHGEVIESSLDEKLSLLESHGYVGSWSIEHPSESYAELAGLLGKLRFVLESRPASA